MYHVDLIEAVYGNTLDKVSECIDFEPMEKGLPKGLKMYSKKFLIILKKGVYILRLSC